MPHRIEYILQMLKHLEFITLNLASFGWILIDINTTDIAEAAEGFSSPTWVTVLVGLSIAFFNIARGIAALKKKKGE